MRVTTGLARGRTLGCSAGNGHQTFFGYDKAGSVQYYSELCGGLHLFGPVCRLRVKWASRRSAAEPSTQSLWMPLLKRLEAVRANLKHCKLSDQAKIAQMVAASFLKSTTTRFDIVFLDPPYQQKIIDAVLPMVVGQMAPQGIILCETERNEQLPESAGDYEIAKTYFYGKAKITAYRRKEGQEEE